MLVGCIQERWRRHGLELWRYHGWEDWSLFRSVGDVTAGILLAMVLSAVIPAAVSVFATGIMLAIIPIAVFQAVGHAVVHFLEGS